MTVETAADEELVSEVILRPTPSSADERTDVEVLADAGLIAAADTTGKCKTHGQAGGTHLNTRSR